MMPNRKKLFKISLEKTIKADATGRPIWIHKRIYMTKDEMDEAVRIFKEKHSKQSNDESANISSQAEAVLSNE